MEKKFYRREIGGICKIRGYDRVLFENEECLNYVAGEHGPEIARYILSLAKLDPQLEIRREDGKTIIGLKKEPLSTFGSLETLERVFMKRHFGVSLSSVDKIIEDSYC